MGSEAVHTGNLKGGRSENQRLLDNAQDIGRRTLLKRLDEGKAPDWTALILGGGW